MKPEDLKPGPIRHEQLSPEFITRMERVRAMLGQVCPLSEAEWRDSFQREANPERELWWWESVAACYVEFTNGRSFSRSERQAAFTIVFGLFSGVEAEQLQTDLAKLPETALDDLAVILNKIKRVN